jgi:transposase
MKESLIAGVDVSKSTLDIFIKPIGLSVRIANSPAGFKQWFQELKKVAVTVSDVMVIMEHTGQYSCRFESFLRSKSIEYCKIAALQIKRSQGIIRGKNDKIDAERIADYGWMRRDTLVADPPLPENITELRSLLSLRLKLVRDRSGYISRLKEMKASGTCTPSDYLGRMQQQIIDVFTRKIRHLEDKIKLLIRSNASIQKTCELLQSIKGVGWIISAHMVSCTDNFKRFRNARKFNCYAGLAPFKHESGSSIRGKARVSHLANKEVKALLNLAASCSIRFDWEMKAYYRKRVAEGKRKMSCLNIIRSKLVARMFAVVKRQTPYQALTAQINPTL